MLRFLALFLVAAVLAQREDVERKFTEYKIDTDLKITAPKKLLEVKYRDRDIKLGDTLEKDLIGEKPTLKLDITRGKMWTLVMVGLDAPSAQEPSKRSWLHWLVINVRGNDIDTGRHVVDYEGPNRGRGRHRYVFLAFEQSHMLENITKIERHGFKVDNFIRQHTLTGPVAGNFFLVEFK